MAKDYIRKKPIPHLGMSFRRVYSPPIIVSFSGFAPESVHGYTCVTGPGVNSAPCSPGMTAASSCGGGCGTMAGTCTTGYDAGVSCSPTGNTPTGYGCTGAAICCDGSGVTGVPYNGKICVTGTSGLSPGPGSCANGTDANYKTNLKACMTGPDPCGYTNCINQLCGS